MRLIGLMGPTRKLANLGADDIERLERHIASVAMDAYDYGKARRRCEGLATGL